MDRRPDPYVRRAVIECVDSLRPSVGVAVAEPQLGPVQRLVESACDVTGVEQSEPDAGLRGGVDQRGTHEVGIVVGSATGLVVHVVELTDGSDAGQCHLCIRRSG